MRGMRVMTADVANLPPAANNFARNNAAASSPSLHVVTTGSDSGCHGYDGGAHATYARPGGGRGTSAGAGNGSSNVVPTIRGVAASPPTGSGSATSSKPKRKRSMIACKNCNERRVRCDGATNGLPCSNCKHAGKSDCRSIESKRIRGARGRFESRDGISTSPTASSKRLVIPSDAAPWRSTARRHSIGGTDSEEWRKLQNSARVAYLGEERRLSWVVQEQLPTREKPLHTPTLTMEGGGGEHKHVNKELWAKGAYVLPRYEVRDLLISQYLEICHPNWPILSKDAFLHSLRTNTFSHQLVQAVLMVAATHCDWAILQRAGYVSRREAVEGFYRRARLLWDGDVEPDKITNIQCGFLMQFWWRAAADHKDPLWWLSGAIRMAQSMGLHRSAEPSRLNGRNKKTWRRLWWLLFLRDRQASSQFGKPMMVQEKDCDVEPLEMEDLEGEVDRVQTLFLLEQLKLAKLVTAITTCEFSPGAAGDLAGRMQLRESCHRRLSEWQQGLPPELVYQSNSKDLWAMCLQMSFLSLLLLLNRPVVYTDSSLPDTMRKPSETIAGDAADAITKISDDLVRMWGARYMTQHSMSCLFSAMTVQRIKRHSADASISADADSKLRQNMRNLVQLDKILPMAGWIHRRYSRILEREDEGEARSVPISPPSLMGDTLAIAPVSPMPASQRSPPPPPPQMRATKEEEPTTVAAAENGAEEEWGDDCGPILNLEHSLTATNAQLEHHLGSDDDGQHQLQEEEEEEEEEEAQQSQVLERQRLHHQQQHGADDLNGMMPDPAAMQPEIFDRHWFMENIGGIANPFWWSQQQGR